MPVQTRSQAKMSQDKVVYLLTPKQQKRYDEILGKYESMSFDEFDEISKNLPDTLLPKDIQDDLVSKFSRRKKDVAYIQYSGLCAKPGNIHSVDEFMNSMYCLCENSVGYNWTVMVASAGAGVIWKV